MRSRDFNNLPAELNRITFEKDETAQRSGVDLIEYRYATGERHVYEVKTDVQSTWDPFLPGQERYRTRPINGGPSKLERTRETLNPLMRAATGNEAELPDGLLNYFIELKQEWGGEGWFPKLKETAGKLNEILPQYDGKINGRDVVFISVIDGEPLDEDKKFFADQDGNLPDGMRSGAGAYVILVPDTTLIEIAEKEKETTIWQGHILPMYKLFERKESDAYTDYWEGEPTQSKHISALTVGKQPNGVYVWPMEPLTIADRAKFIELVEAKNFYTAEVKRLKGQ